MMARHLCHVDTLAAAARTFERSKEYLTAT